MAVTQEQIDALTDAIASAEKQVADNGTQITYRSFDELMAARAALQRQFDAEQAALSGKPRAPRIQYLYQTTRG